MRFQRKINFTCSGILELSFAMTSISVDLGQIRVEKVKQFNELSNLMCDTLGSMVHAV